MTTKNIKTEGYNSEGNKPSSNQYGKAIRRVQIAFNSEPDKIRKPKIRGGERNSSTFWPKLASAKGRDRMNSRLQLTGPRQIQMEKKSKVVLL